MSQETIDQGVKSYYTQQTLSSEVLARLEAMTEQANEQGRVAPPVVGKTKFWRSGKYLALAASLIFSLIIGMQFGGLYQEKPADLLSRVAQEVALNHNKQLTSDYISDSYEHLALVMDKLDFNLIAPAALQGAGYQLLGARYCSIQGNIAAQLKLRNQQGGMMTLYVSRLNDALTELQHKNQSRERLLIHNWYEGELFYSLATPE